MLPEDEERAERDAIARMTVRCPICATHGPHFHGGCVDVFQAPAPRHLTRDPQPDARDWIDDVAASVQLPTGLAFGLVAPYYAAAFRAALTHRGARLFGHCRQCRRALHWTQSDWDIVYTEGVCHACLATPRTKTAFDESEENR